MTDGIIREAITMSYNETSFYQFNVDLKKEDIIKELDEFVPTKRVYVKKEKSPRMYVTALVRFTYWTGTRNHPQKWEKQAIVNYMSDNKKIHVDGETKIFSKLTVVDKLESKYKYLLPKKNWVTYNKRV